MMQAVERLLQVVECQAFELCGPYSEAGRDDYYVPYMMNDAVEYYLILRNCRLVGEYLLDSELEQNGRVEQNENGFILAVRQGNENAFTLSFSTIEEKVQCFQYHEIGHFWVKGQEQWRQLVYMLGTIHDKYTFLGESFCNEKELKLLNLVEFAPLHEWSPIHDSLEDTYPETWKGIEAMEQLAKQAGDLGYLRWIRVYRCFPYLKKVLRDKLQHPKREKMYRLLYKQVKEASLKYPKRVYEETVLQEIETARAKVKEEMKKRGFHGEYPAYQKEVQKILVTEEQPFTIMEWNHYKFNISFMISEYKKMDEESLNSGFFCGKGRKGWIEKYDYKL